ncbi:hypothetical protein JKF63_02609 [Porcisia hertigi]|uniref:Uncharacterized protein n=1 Tax=Porcisia hertigi TaxID=2761500 RepID=A0A836I199_9TRYP|nr:hypothetical protein JKF63_02609 [Porcisia hertigi]
MPPSALSHLQRPRHITASINVLASRLTRNTVERVTIGNTPLHTLHLCDARCVAPLFASCVSLTVITIHLKYVASSTALEVLICAAATSPTLRHISVMGGVTSMEAAAMASGLAAFTWNPNIHGQRVSCVDAVSSSPRPRTAGPAPPTPTAHRFSGRRYGERGNAFRRWCLASGRPTALSPYASSSSLTRLQLRRYPNSGRCAPPPPDVSLRATHRDLRANGAWWPVRHAVSPRIALVSRPESQASSPGLSRPRRHATPLSAHPVEGGVSLTLELHRLEEATAAMLLDGLRRAHRILSVEVRLCVSTAEARRIGHHLAQEAKKAVARHHDQRLLKLATSAANVVAPEGCPPPARWEGRNSGAHRPRPRYIDGLPACPRQVSHIPAPPSCTPLQRPLPSLRSGPLVKHDARRTTHEGRRPRMWVEELLPRQGMAGPHTHLLSPKSLAAGAWLPHRRIGSRADTHTSTMPSPAFSAGARATPKPHQPVLFTKGRMTVLTSKSDGFRRCARHSPSPVLAEVVSGSHAHSASLHRHLARTGRLYSPPRWARRPRPFTNVAAPLSLPPSDVGLCPSLQSASASSTSSPALERLELRASWSSWSSRSSSPLPRPPRPSSREAAEAFANFVAREQATGSEKREGADGPTPRTPPAAISARTHRRSIRRRAGFSASQLCSPPPHASVLSSSRYCLRRGRDNLVDKAEPRGVPTSQTPPHRSSSRCSCFVCGSRSASSLAVGTLQPPRPAPPLNSENEILFPANPVTRAPCPNLPLPHPSLSSSPLSEPSSLTSPAQRARRLHNNEVILTRGGRSVGRGVTPAKQSVATSVDGITPSRGQEGGGRESDGATPASSSSRRTARAVHTSTSSPHRSLRMDPGESDSPGGQQVSALARMVLLGSGCQASHSQVLHTQLPSSALRESPGHKNEPLAEEVGYVVYPNSVDFLRARVTEINRHVVWHQIQSSKAAEAHSKRLAELEVSFSDRVTEELTDILMVLTDMEHGSRIDGRR